MSKVFISHVSSEVNLALALKEALHSSIRPEPDVFLSSDLESIAAGEQWLKAVERSLSEAAVVLVLCSRASMRSQWVLFESGAAWQKQVALIPVCHTNLLVQDLGLPLSIFKGVNLKTAEGLDRVCSAVIRAVGGQRNTDGLALSARNLIAAEAAEIARQRKGRSKQFRRAVVSGVATLLAGAILVGIYFFAHRLYGRERAGYVLELSALLVTICFGGLHRLFQGRFRSEPYLLSGVVIAVTAGFGSSVVYLNAPTKNNVGWLFQPLEALAFFCFAMLGFAVGGAAVDWAIGRDFIRLPDLIRHLFYDEAQSDAA